jgi:hypothetical protein
MDATSDVTHAMREQTTRRTAMRAGTSRARVIAVYGDVVGVQADGATFRAERALSCLVEPRVGDLVLVNSAEEGAYVLSILGRSSRGDVRLVVQGDAELSATGKLAIASDTKLELRAPVLEVHATDGALFIERLSYWGTRVQALLGQVRLCASSVDSVVDRVSEHVKQAFRTVHGLEQLRAGRIDYRAEEDVCVRGENAVITTRNLAKIDGKQIHIG